MAWVDSGVFGLPLLILDLRLKKHMAKGTTQKNLVILSRTSIRGQVLAPVGILVPLHKQGACESPERGAIISKTK
jgi:hypothetical protein